MKIQLILPKADNKVSSQFDFRFLSRLLSPITGDGQGASIMGSLPIALPTIAALTPPDIEVIITDENIEPIRYDGDADVVGISFLTFASDRAYEVAGEFRKRGVYVVLGGIHVSMLPEEAAQHADTLFIGEAEETWPRFIDDFRNNAPRSVYRAERKPDLEEPVVPRWDLVKNRYYYTYHVQTTRGCAFDCDFCPVSAYQGKPRHKPIQNVIAEIEAVRKYTRTAGTETIVFADDNINGDRGYSIELFKALAPLGIRWSAQCSVNIGRDEELLDLAQESGCQSLLMGFESISQESLESINKGSLNKVEEFEEIIDRIHARKINIYFMVVLGLDGDDETVFEKTSEFLTQTSVAYPAFNILTPVPGTRLYSRLEDEGRLLHKRWGEYAGSVACFRPRNMSIETLQQGFYWIMKEQYSLDAVLERIGKLWNQGVIRLERRYLFARLVVTILLALQWLCNRGEMAELVKKTIQLLWQKKWINIDVLLINLTCFEFAKTLPAPNLDFCSGASGRREGM